MTHDSRVPIVVVAAIILRDGRYLLSRRLSGTHMAGLWEFPGGKCEPGESHEACLAREIHEELGVGSRVGDEVFRTEHSYPERTVHLFFHSCDLDDEPKPVLGQELRWVTRAELLTLDFPAADAELIHLLTARGQ